MRSSTTTNIIAPAANAKNHSCAAVRFAARKYPMTANIGSTAPLPIPYKKALPRLPVAVFMGRETRHTHGKTECGNKRALLSERCRRSERKAYGKTFGNIVYGDGKKEFSGLLRWLFNPSSSFVPL